MGVHGLWQILAPVGRRVSIETMRNKVSYVVLLPLLVKFLIVLQRVAVDVSIWLTQFLKAMRDEEGNPLPDAHIIGVYRRVLKVCLLGK